MSSSLSGASRLAGAAAKGTTRGTKDGEEYYKNLLELSWREKSQLKERLETLERENRDLRRSVFELSLKRSVSTHAAASFDIDAALRNEALDANAVASAASTGYAAAGAEALSVQKAQYSYVSPFGAALDRGNSKSFAWKLDLTGHTSSVYTVRFSPCGRFLASGSFDRSVRVWAVEKLADSANVCVGDAHAASVVALAWSADSTTLVSGGYDLAVHEWDVEAQRSQPIASYSADGFVQTVAISPSASPSVVYVGTSRGKIQCFDRRDRTCASEAESTSSRSGANSELSAGLLRSPKQASSSAIESTAGDSVSTIHNDAMVNSLCMASNGVQLISGDHAGAVKTWDTRVMRVASASPASARSSDEPLSILMNDTDRRPVTHVHLSPSHTSADVTGEEGRFLAVNSYDNFLRVYDRGSPALLFGAASNRSLPRPRARNALRGVENRSWPIQSSFFRGSNFREPHEGSSPAEGARLSDQDGDSLGLRSAHRNLGADDEEDDIGTVLNSTDDASKRKVNLSRLSLSSRTAGNENGAPSHGGRRTTRDNFALGLDRSLLLASGSADGNAYLFDVSSATDGGLLEVLRGHSERVYCANFHPVEPILATSSADNLIKIWAPAKRNDL